MTADHPRVIAVRRRTWGRSAWFWIRRYLPAELAGTATMLCAGVAVSSLAVPPIVIGIVGSEAEGVGFYAVAGIVVWREQRRHGPGRRRFTVLLKVAALLLFEFGPAELLDTFLVRPATLTLGVHLLGDVGWGLVVGKIVADIIFYVLAATAFRVTEKTGVRGTDASPGESALIRTV